MDFKEQSYQGSFSQLETTNDQLTSIVFNYEIFKRLSWFLSLKDVLSLGQTCKNLYQFVEKHQEFFAETYYKLFLNEQLEMTLEISYPDIGQRTSIRKKNFDQSAVDWKQQLKKMIQIKYSNDIIFGRQTLKIPFMLCEAVFPRPILRRETIGLYCESEFQVMLAQRLELEQKGFDKQFESQFITDEVSLQPIFYQFMCHLKQNKQQIVAEMQEKLDKFEELKLKFLRQRWCILEDSEEFIELSLQKMEVQEPPPLQKQQIIEEEQDQICIVNLLDQIQSSIDCYLQGLSKYFSHYTNLNIMNSVDILSEYVMYWQSYSNTIVELSTLIYPLENIVNELHQIAFPKHPQYPKFSVWRLMIKSWIKNVNSQKLQKIIRNENFSTILQECFIRLLNAQRQSNFVKEFDQGVNQDQDEIPSFQITHEIYDNFLLKQRISYKEQFQIDTTHKFYTEFIELMSSFCRAIQDLSVSEVSVHWIGHNDCTFEEFYDQLCEKIQHESSLYYDETKTVFGSNMISFIEFCKFDKEFLQQILPEQLLFKIENLQKEHVYTSLYYFLEHTYLEKFVQQNKEQIGQLYKSNIQQNQKQERTSISSSQYNEHLETQSDANLNDAQKFFNFALENCNIDFDELFIKEKNKNQQEPLVEIIKVSLSQMNLEQFSNQDDCDQFQTDYIDYTRPPKIHRTFSNHKYVLEQTEVPEEIVKAVKQHLLSDSEFLKLYSAFNEYTNYYEKNLLGVIQRNRELEIINDDREIPRVLPEYLQNFYFVTKEITQQLLEENLIEEEEDNVDELDQPPTLSKNSSKHKKSSMQMEYYYSDEEDEVSNDDA